jgi:hypothetical protein
MPLSILAVLFYYRGGLTLAPISHRLAWPWIMRGIHVPVRAVLARIALVALYGLLVGCATLKNTPQQDYVWTMGRACDERFRDWRMDRVDPDGHAHIKAVTVNMTGGDWSQYVDCLNAQFSVHPYREWVRQNIVVSSEVPPKAAAETLARQPDCHVDSFHGATLPQGAVASMRVVNTGRACGIVNYGVPADRSNPAEAGSITRKPAHGTAEFVASQAKYTPERGYVGGDEFEYEAIAKGESNQQVRLKVRVKVLIVAP